MEESRYANHPIWLPQPFDIARSYAGFQRYLSLGIRRTTAAVAEQIRANGGRCGDKLVEKWATAYHWVERAAAYDAHIQNEVTLRLQELAIDNEVRDLEGFRQLERENARHLMAAGKAALALAMKRMGQISQAVEKMDAKSVPNYLKAGADLIKIGGDALARSLAIEDLQKLVEDGAGDRDGSV